MLSLEDTPCTCLDNLKLPNICNVLSPCPWIGYSNKLSLQTAGCHTQNPGKHDLWTSSPISLLLHPLMTIHTSRSSLLVKRNQHMRQNLTQNLPADPQHIEASNMAIHARRVFSSATTDISGASWRNFVLALIGSALKQAAITRLTERIGLAPCVPIGSQTLESQPSTLIASTLMRRALIQ